MPPVVAFIAAYLVTIGVSVAIASIIATVVVDSVIAFALGKIARALSGNPSYSQGPPQQTVTVNGTLEPRRIVYGQVRASGVVAFYGTSSTTGSTQDYLWYVISLAGHQCDSIGDVILDSTTILAANINAVTGVVTQAPFTGFLNIWRLTGSSTEVVQPDWDAAFTAIGTNHIGYGVSKLVIRMKRSTTAWPNGAPSNFQALISGKRVYDPRLDSTNGGAGAQRLTDATTWTFSANPALCAADYFTGGSIYYSVATPVAVLGMGVPTARVNWSFVSAAANECDQVVNLPASATQLRYVIGAVLSCGDTHDTNLDVILATMIGQRIFSQGQYRIYAGEYDAPGVTITDNDLTIDGYTVAGATTGTDLYNTVVANYYDPARDWQNVQCAVRTQATFVTADNNQTLLRTVTLAGVTNEYRAQRICEVLKKQSRNMIVATLNLKLTGVKIAPWETFNLTLAEQGWQNKVFRAQAVEMDLANRRIIVTAKEESSSPYTDPLTTDYAAPNTIAPSSTAEAPDDPAGLTAISEAYGISFNWTASQYFAPGSVYELWEYTASTPFSSATLLANGITTTSYFLPKTDNVTRYYWIRANFKGLTSNPYPGVTGVAGVALFGAAAPTLWVARGNCVVNGTSFQKVAGSTFAWNSDVYSLLGFGICHLSWKPNDSSLLFMLALSSNIQAVPNYTGLDYALFCQAGTIQIYESGINTFSPGITYTKDDWMSITYDGSNVRYYKNQTLIRTIAAAGLTLRATSGFCDALSSCNLVDFGPTLQLPSTSTGMIDANAATVAAQTYIATAALSGGFPLPVNAGILTMPVDPNPATFQVTANFDCNYVVQAGGAQKFYLHAVIGASGFDSTGQFVVASGSSATPDNKTLIFNFSYPGGSVVCNVGLYWQPPAAGNTATVRNLTIKGEYIKR